MGTDSDEGRRAAAPAGMWWARLVAVTLVVAIVAVATWTVMSRPWQRGSQPGAAAYPSQTPTSMSAPAAVPTVRTATRRALPVKEIVATTQISSEAGTVVGPHWYERSHGTAVIVYQWEARNAGTRVETDTCAVTVTITGPQQFGPFRSTLCSDTRYVNTVEITKPGGYSLSVTESGSKTSNSWEFQVS